MEPRRGEERDIDFFFLGGKGANVINKDSWSRKCKNNPVYLNLSATFSRLLPHKVDVTDINSCF